MPPKQWQVFPGKTLFYLGGRCQSGPDRLNFFIALCLLVLLGGLFEIWVGPWLITELTPGYGIVLFVIHFVVLAFTTVNFFVTAFKDPGIIPRDKRKKEELEKNPFSRPPNLTPIIINGLKLKLKWCETCAIYRPPRCSHCSICDNCVRRFDHHCPWLGNCVGERNYSSFLWFVFSTTFLAVYSCGLCIAHITVLSLRSHDSGFMSFLDALGKAPVSMVIALLTSLAFCLVSTLCGYHCYLLFINQSTNENLKGGITKKTNPFWRGRFMYAFEMLFPVRWAKHHNWSEPVEPYSSHPGVNSKGMTEMKLDV